MPLARATGRHLPRSFREQAPVSEKDSGMGAKFPAAVESGGVEEDEEGERVLDRDEGEGEGASLW